MRLMAICALLRRLSLSHDIKITVEQIFLRRFPYKVAECMVHSLS